MVCSDVKFYHSLVCVGCKELDLLFVLTISMCPLGRLLFVFFIKYSGMPLSCKKADLKNLFLVIGNRQLPSMSGVTSMNTAS